jgi:hypothetical protein
MKSRREPLATTLQHAFRAASPFSKNITRVRLPTISVFGPSSPQFKPGRRRYDGYMFSSSSQHLDHEHQPSAQSQLRLQQKNVQNKLSSFTSQLTNPTIHPLGTLSNQHWSEAFEIMIQSAPYWSQVAKSTSRPVFEPHTRDDKDPPLIDGYIVHEVDRLLQRLIFEFHATATVPFHHRSTGSGSYYHSFPYIVPSLTLAARDDLRRAQLSQWMILTMQAWLECLLHHPKSLLAFSKALDLAYRVAGWRELGTLQGDFPWQAFVALVQCGLRVGTADAVFAAVHQLLYLTDLWDTSSSESSGDIDLDFIRSQCLIPLYHDCLETCLQLASDTAQRDGKVDEESEEITASTINSLLSKMDRLSREMQGWEAVAPDEEAIEDVVDRMLDVSPSVTNEAPADNVSTRQLSHFELNALRARVLKSINDAMNGDNRHDIENILDQWARLAGTRAENDSEVATSLLHFFVRAGDPRQATRWLRAVDQLASAADTSGEDDPNRTSLTSRFALFESVIASWMESDQPEATWRAEELLRRLENLSKSPTAPPSYFVPLHLLEGVALGMLETGDSRGSRKAQDILAQVPLGASSPGLLMKTIQSKLRSQKSSSQNVLDAANSLAKNWSVFTEEQQQTLVVEVTDGLARSELFGNAIRFVAFLNRQGHLLPCDSMVKLIHSLPKPVNPDELIALLGSFENAQCGVEGSVRLLSPSCYLASVKLVLEEPGATTIPVLSNCALSLLECWKRSNFSVDEETKTALNEVMERLGERRRPEVEEIVRKTLGLLEDADKQNPPSCPLNISCFELALDIDRMRGDWRAVIALFEDINSCFQSGISDLEPTAAMHAHLFHALSSLYGVQAITTMEQLYAKLRKNYDSRSDTKRDMFKPNEILVRHMMVTLTKSARPFTKALEDQVLFLIDEIEGLSISVPRESPIVFNQALEILLETDKSKAFDRTQRVLHLMKDCGVLADFYTYRLMIRSCTRAQTPQEKRLGAALALSALDEMRARFGADAGIYGTVTAALRQCSHPLDPAFISSLKSVFDKCLEDGRLHPSLRSSFKLLVSKDIWREWYRSRLLADGSEPKEWSCNAASSVRKPPPRSTGPSRQ